MPDKEFGSNKNRGAGDTGRLSDDEYEQRIIELYETLPPMPTRAEEERVRRIELDLKIDNRLGYDFPMDRREALWNIHRNIERRRLRLTGRFLLGRIFSRSLSKDADNLANYLVEEYATVLSKRELERFFDLREGERASLPFDANFHK